jgi:hypothetical protein
MAAVIDNGRGLIWVRNIIHTINMKNVLMLLSLAILGTVVAAAVLIFQIGNGNRSIKCKTVDSFADDDDDEIEDEVVVDYDCSLANPTEPCANQDVVGDAVCDSNCKIVGGDEDDCCDFTFCSGYCGNFPVPLEQNITFNNFDGTGENKTFNFKFDWTEDSSYIILEPDKLTVRQAGFSGEDKELTITLDSTGTGKTGDYCHYHRLKIMINGHPLCLIVPVYTSGVCAVDDTLLIHQPSLLDLVQDGDLLDSDGETINGITFTSLSAGTGEYENVWISASSAFIDLTNAAASFSESLGSEYHFVSCAIDFNPLAMDSSMGFGVAVEEGVSLGLDIYDYYTVGSVPDANYMLPSSMDDTLTLSELYTYTIDIVIDSACAGKSPVPGNIDCDSMCSAGGGTTCCDEEYCDENYVLFYDGTETSIPTSADQC